MAYDTAVVLGFLGISAIMGYLAMNVDKKEHGAIQILFVFVSMVFQYATLGAIKGILENESITKLDPLVNAALSGYFWIIFFVMFYMLAVFVWNLRKLADLKKQEKSGIGGDVSL